MPAPPTVPSHLSLLQACRGRVDAALGPYLGLVLERLPRTSKRPLKDALLGVLADALYYNPGATLGVLAANGAVVSLFSGWFSMIFARRWGAFS